MSIEFLTNEEADELLEGIEDFPIKIYNENDVYAILSTRNLSLFRKIINYFSNLKKEIPVYQSVELAERYYGDLQGLNKQKTREKYGAEQVQLWRRSYDINPPNGESLKDTSERTIPYFKRYILKDLKEGKDVLVSAHGNSLRSIVMYVENVSKEEIPTLEIPTGVPIVYSFDGKMNLIDKKLL